MSIEKNTLSKLRHRGLGFTTMINETTNKIGSMEATGLYCYLSSKPESWIIREKDIMTRFNCGRDKVRSAMKCLKNIGLITTERSQDKNGKFSGCDIILHNMVIDDHMTGFPADGIPGERKTHLHSNKGLLTRKEKSSSTATSKDAPPPRIQNNEVQPPLLSEEYEMIKNAGVNVPDRITPGINGMLKKAIAYLEDNGLTFNDFMNELSENCTGYLNGFYLKNGKECKNDIFVILKLSNIEKVLNGKLTDRE